MSFASAFETIKNNEWLRIKSYKIDYQTAVDLLKQMHIVDFLSYSVKQSCSV
jgi:hypothetical protein